MKKILCLSVLACAFCLAPYTSAAQSSKKAGKRSTQTVAKLETSKGTAASAPKTSEPPEAAGAPKDGEPAAKADEQKDGDAKPAEGAVALGFGGMGGGDFPFDLVQASSIEFNPDGMTVLTSKVRIESKDFNISCDQFKMDKNTNIVYATGNPVKLDQGTAVQAICRNLIYNLTTRSATLENDASIIQDKGGQKMKATADKIIIDNSVNKGGKDGQPKVSLIMREGSNNLPKIEVLGKAGKTDAAKKPARTQKVSGNNMDLIKVPSLSKAPGVD